MHAMASAQKRGGRVRGVAQGGNSDSHVNVVRILTHLIHLHA